MTFICDTIVQEFLNVRVNEQGHLYCDNRPPAIGDYDHPDEILKRELERAEQED